MAKGKVLGTVAELVDERINRRKRRRNDAPLGPGVAADRIRALRLGLRAELDEAMERVLVRQRAREDEIIARVPQAERPIAVAMLAAAEPTAGDGITGGD